jgi:GNAT superfamily N-acetyltransferase
MNDDLVVRRAGPNDLPAVLELLRESMGRADDARFDDLFRWKHLDNAFGPSPMWVACAGERVVGLRVFMQWEWLRAGEVLRSVRAVDTATHPEFQGRGIFTRLTLGALPELAEEGIGFVFNTPNEQSRPGYLKMGWAILGRAPAALRPLTLRRPQAFAALARREPAAHFSEPATFGEPVADVLGDCDLDALLARAAARDGRLRTNVSRGFLAWRYGSPLLHYRAVAAPKGVGEGLALVRVRRRGAARELVLAALLAPDPARSRRLAAAVRRAARGQADYALGLGAVPGCLPVPRFGPVVTAREVGGPPPDTVRAFDLTLGDIELF